MDIETAKQFLRIDGNDQDVMIGMLIDAGQEFVTNATGFTFASPTRLSDLAVITLVTKWYENPEMLGKGNIMDFGLQSILTQLSCYSGGGTTV